MLEERIISLENEFAERSRDLKFYDFPAYWKDTEIYDSLKQVGYIERLEVKWNYKYRTVRARIRLTKGMEESFIKGGSNIAIKKNDRYYFCSMFDAKLSATDIKKRYEWQAYKKLNKEECEEREDKIEKFIISNMAGSLGDGLKIKNQDELIGEEGTTLEEHEELDNLNKNFSKNLEEINKEKDSLPSTSKKGKKVIRDEENEEKINENKKRMGHKQGERKDSDEE
ncbi:hypothetical protein RhiirA4_465395 [Rhizophagus irregularis]|uniref:Uncharacterized protein n=1 Tax=Rhizophagus irregularis TaxID=588596 RepID=A0A2I1GS59_9GLOM|nr:hypothetical protein RhiirA4_465395 [Rhizophagus irregularis]